MIEIIEKDGAILFHVRVVPRASISEIVGEHDEALKIRISAPPVDGAANKELVKLLAKTLRVAKRDIEIVGGETSRLKHVRIRGCPAAAFRKAVVGRS